MCLIATGLKKTIDEGKKCHAKTMKSKKADKTVKKITHHVPPWQKIYKKKQMGFFFPDFKDMDFQKFAVGDRVQSRDEYRATVMYVGSVAGASPEDGWIGLQVKTLHTFNSNANTLMQTLTYTYILHTHTHTHTSGTCQGAASTPVTSRACSTSPALRPAAPSYDPTLSFSRLSASRSVIPKMKSSPLKNMRTVIKNTVRTAK